VNLDILPFPGADYDLMRTRWCRLLRLILIAGALGVLSLSLSSCAQESPASQPIAFSHRQHVEKKLACTFCHFGAEKNAQAVIPSVALCMSCHSAVKADSPEVLKVKQYLDRKEEIPWQRIYALPPEADVFFNHHRHAAAGVPCATCHGQVGTRDALHKEVKLTMGFCVNCHLEKRSSFRMEQLAGDCSTCHR
jgi:hypothetical protein